MEDLEPQVRKACEKSKEVLQKLEAHLNPMFKMERADVQRLPAVDAARVNIASAFAMVNLFHMYLRTQGEEVDREHRLHEESRRVHAYLEKLRAATEAIAKRKTEVNVDAAERLFAHIIGGPLKEKKRKVRAVEEKGEAKHASGLKAAANADKAPSAAQKDVSPEAAPETASKGPDDVQPQGVPKKRRVEEASPKRTKQKKKKKKANAAEGAGQKQGEAQV
jgi:hypothetical protein|uniref:Nuclear nucleic acid-binding protein C1D n=1 Tax=Eutreptiella gymnastica TaxID=73025 RepID=A0A7S4CYL2_9EUGL|mmetsp:Transcript_61190/g.101132  ORF Transcript_61190/g.101132 Transcript_61190/m.101132 type:complete len:221 (+) Transcript_61190:105-767(+)|eukprot:CAMPEP_0174283502 /NCGR_PEP_ID=MMETSP0809-20121228/4210_1 /TAXON_ID=73025 ORGANISM="Eutreptiella gymnastica-like, Strain CCMP1594" /NCGR_SAMPLE_ID=MMETSP0809 /ASSEMBLY_ACC=CAM_ASM_000658 /LENGTH=220 /DNA_ID=CAMNT_0015378489 /DNA_START=54 /DNA_END=716 /DNA_ORIENTATION=-